jgi:hypothetical protein
VTPNLNVPIGPQNPDDQRPRLGPYLVLDRCPHCSIAQPSLIQVRLSETNKLETQAVRDGTIRRWEMYACTFCGGVILAASKAGEGLIVSEYYPRLATPDAAIPQPAREYLKQAQESAPAGAVMLCASAVDAMLKAKDSRKVICPLASSKLPRAISSPMTWRSGRTRCDSMRTSHGTRMSRSRFRRRRKQSGVYGIAASQKSTAAKQGA